VGLLSNRLGFNALSLEDPATALLPASAMFESLGLGRSDAGVLINNQAAMRITTAQVCVKIISEDMSANGHEIFQRMPDGSIRLATDHRLWTIIHDQPNPNMSAAVFWGALVASAVGWGNGYAWIKRDRAARAIALVPLKSGLTSPVKVGGKLMYATTQTETGTVAYIDPEDVLHVMGLTHDGIIGINPIESCKNAFGLALAAEKFGAQLFGNGARASGVLTHPGVLEDEAYENLKKSVRDRSTGDNALTPMILEEGMKWEQITINPNDAQFLATRQFQRTEIAGLFRVPLHLVGDLTRATNNNIEHQSLDYVRYCLRPWAVRIEQEVNRKLLGGPFTMEHNFNDMQRGDFASQTAGYQTLRNIGVYSTNDILRSMRQNPIPADEGGDVRTIQGAMIPLTALLAEEDKPAAPETAGTDSGEGDAQPFNRIAPAFRKLFRDAVGRTINRSGDKDFTRKAFQPVVSSFMQALLALRYGNRELTAKELALIDAQTDLIANAAPTWDRKDAAAIATRLTDQIYTALAAELLQ
jgi:HK97 family phage portal protein